MFTIEAINKINNTPFYNDQH